jgi:hypothetical protein
MLIAQTTANKKTCALLQKAGFTVDQPTPDGQVRATLPLERR